MRYNWPPLDKTGTGLTTNCLELLLLDLPLLLSIHLSFFFLLRAGVEGGVVDSHGSNIVGLGIIWSWLTYNAFIGLLWFITSRQRQITDVCYKSLFSYFLGGSFTRVFIDFSTALVIGGCDVMFLRFYFVKCEFYVITFSRSDSLRF